MEWYEHQPVTLKDLMAAIAKEWPFTEKRYPALKDLSDAASRERFAVAHILLHITVDSAKVARMAERGDHRKTLSSEQSEDFRMGVIDLVRDALRLADATGWSAEELAAELLKSKQ